MKHANKMVAKELKVMQTKFEEEQRKRFSSLDVDEDDALVSRASNRVIKCVNACKKSHNGPLVTKEELDELVSGWKGTEKSLHSALNLEIRFRKYTFTKVKLSCLLFKQRGLIVPQKVKNLTALIESQLDLKSLAEMEDLATAILASDDTNQIGLEDGNEDELVVQVHHNSS